MKKLSFRKIILLVLVIFLLANMKPIAVACRLLCNWFAESLAGLNNFSEGAQTAIAFTSIILLVVLIFKQINK